VKEIIALAGKDLRILIRDKAGFFFVFFFPLLYAIFFGVVFSGGGDSRHAIPIALVDEDSSAQSAKFIQTLSGKDELEILQTSRAEAISLVQRGKRSAYVVLKRGFGQAKEKMFWGDPAEMEMGLDPTRKAEAGMLQGVLTRYFMEGMQEVFSSTTAGRKQVQLGLDAVQGAPGEDQKTLAPLQSALQQLDRFLAQVETTQATGDTLAQGAGSRGWEPLKITTAEIAVQREGPKNSFEVTFPQAIVWGLIGTAAAFGISLVVERTRGTLLRLRIAPISRSQILAGKALACFVTTFAVTGLLFLISIVIFGVRPYSLPLLALAMTASSLCFVGLMMLLAVLGKTEASAGGIGWAVLLVMAMIGGGMVPLFFMPSWMKALSNASPVKWAILSMEGAVWRGSSLELMLGHCAVLVGIGAVCFAVGVKVFSRMAD
jgi:ABC-2 type transport system permease protein